MNTASSTSTRLNSEQMDEETLNWVSLVDLLSSNHLSGADWMTVFKGLAKSVEGREREAGIDLAKAALRRVEMSIEAIADFPRIFELARDKVERGAMTFVSMGGMKHQLHLFEKESGVPGSAVDLGVKIVQSLQTANVKEADNDFLLIATVADVMKPGASPEKTIFEIFSNTHGVAQINASAALKGTSVLHWGMAGAGAKFGSSLKSPVRTLIAGHLLDLGFDPTAKDRMGNTALMDTLLSDSESAETLKAFVKRGALSKDEVVQLAKDPEAILDPQSRAHIAERHASLVIDSVTAKRPSLKMAA